MKWQGVIMGEYDVNEILSKDGLKHIDLGDGQSERFTSLKELIEENSKHKSWAKRIIDTSNSGYFQIATFVCQSEKGSGCRRHYHPDTDEWWVVIKGEIEFEIGDNEEKILGEPGDVIFCKKGILHKISIISDEPCIRLSIAVDNQETIHA